MRTSIKTLALVAMAAIAASCETAKLQEETVPAEGMYAVIPNPVQGELAATKALNTDMQFSFSPSDKIDVFAGEEGEQMIYKITVSDSNTKSCSFKVGSFGLLDGTYYTLYPTQGAVDDYTAVPVSFLGQTQNGNNNSNHLAAYDFNTSNAEVVSNNATFEYDHCVCWFPLDLTFPVATTVKSVSICTPSAAIPTAAKINVQTGAITTTAVADELTVTFAEPVEVAANGVVTVFITTAPFTIPGELEIKANCETEGQAKVYSASVSTSATTQAGVFYRLAKTLVDPDDKSVAIVAGVKYDVLADAIAAAEEGQTVEITKAGEYTLPAVSKNITIKGNVTGVVFKHTTSGSIASIPNGCSFENVQFELGTVNYHGFQHAGTIEMYGCTINGLLFSYGVMNFNGCTFNNTGDYCMWNYGTDNTYTDCTFNTNGKALNVYCENNSVVYNITLDGCTFNSTKLNKAAVNVKETCGANMLKYNVVIKNCTIGTPEFYPAPSADATGTLYVIDPLVQVDDRNLSATESGITVTLNDEVVYPVVTIKPFYQDESDANVYHISNAEGLWEFAQSANGGVSYAGKTILLDADVDLENAAWSPINVPSMTFDGQNHTVKNVSVSGEKNVGLFGYVDISTIKNLTVDGAEATGINHVAALAGHGVCLKIENCTVKNAKVTASVKDGDDGDKAGAIAGYISGESISYVKNCAVENCEVTAYRDLAAVVGMANGGAEVSGNTAKDCTVTCNKTENYKNYSTDAQHDAQEIVGEAASAATVSNNTFSNVTVVFFPESPASSAIKIGDAEYDSFADAVKAAIAANDGTPIKLESDVVFADGAEWEAVTFNGGTLVIDGQGHTVKGLPGMLLNKQGSGGHHVRISNITFDGAKVDEKSDYASVIVGYADSMNELYFENVTIKNSTVVSSNYAGAFVGYAAGYNVTNNGPVYQQVTFKNCVVENCSITGGGSTGALMGHAAGNVNAVINVEGTSVTGNTIKCTGSSTNKAGSLFGTVGAAGSDSTAEAPKGLFVSASVSGNTVNSGSATVSTICGRQGTGTGRLVMTAGGSYDARPFNESDTWASCVEGYELKESNGVWTVAK